MATRLGKGGQRLDAIELLVVDSPSGEPRSLWSRLTALVLARATGR